MLTVGLADPGGSSALAGAVSWVQSAMLGTLATTIATIAVAAVGILAMSGRMPLRRGLMVILGCFILFGAPAIAAGLLALTSAGGATPVASGSASMAAASVPQAVPTSRPQVYDPYAGASVPPR